MNENLISILYHTVQENNILPLTSSCNVRCMFCSHQNNPKGVRAVAVPPLSLERVKDLLNFIRGDRKIVIGESASLIMEGEPFSHPHIFACLDLIREKFKDTLIQITTNGSYLDRNTVSKLSEYKPIEINLSLNTATKETRKKLMNDKRGDVSCNAPYLLKEYGIKFQGSVVAMPHILGFDDLKNTLNVLNDSGAETIRVFKPGFSSRAKENLRAPKEIVKELEEKIKKWRQGLCPVTLEPPSFHNLDAEVIGVIKNSRADQTGIKAGDIILEIDGIKPFSRVDAFNRVHKNGLYRLKISRDEEIKEIDLNVTDNTSGLVFDYDISIEKVEQIKENIASYESVNPLILTSEFAYDVIRLALKDLNNLDIIPVKNNFFGGNIKAAGLLTIDDIKSTLLNYKTIKTPDLVLLPSIAFDMQGKDLVGNSVWDIEEIAECPVVLS